MIVLDDVYKRYQTDHGPGKWVLQGASLVIPPKTNVGLIGINGAGKSTLLRLIGGTDFPNRGSVARHCRVSWPLGLGGGLQGSLTGRQNAKFVCRIHGHEDDMDDRLAYIQDFAELGAAFDEPVKTYSSGMQARLKFATSLAFDFDVYLSDELTAVGDEVFRKKATVAFAKLTDRAGLIMVSHVEATLKEYCSAGVLLHEGRVHWFDRLDEALKEYRKTLGIEEPKPVQANPVKPPDDPVIDEKIDRIKRFQGIFSLLSRGLSGDTVHVNFQSLPGYVKHASFVAMKLMSADDVRSQGFAVKPGVVPLLRAIDPAQGGRIIELYDLNSQCVKIDQENTGE